MVDVLIESGGERVQTSRSLNDVSDMILYQILNTAGTSFLYVYRKEICFTLYFVERTRVLKIPLAFFTTEKKIIHINALSVLSNV